MVDSKRSHFLIATKPVDHSPQGLVRLAERELGDSAIELWADSRVKWAANDQFLLIIVGEAFSLAGDRLTAKKMLSFQQLQNFSGELLNGSFALAIIELNTGNIQVVTDTVNSRKVFRQEEGGSNIYATSLHLMSTKRSEIDQAALGCYLANGVIYQHRTLFKNIKIVPAATRLEDRKGVIATSKYWSYQISVTKSDTPRRELLEEYKALLIKSVEIRSGYQDHHFISISGGYDSVGLAGIMQLLGRNNVSCFSYIYGEARPGADAYVAGKAAEGAGFPHQIIQSYQGGLIETIQENGRLGEGMANFCDEIDIWKILGPQVESFSNPSLFAGDMYYLPNVEPQNETDAITAVGINPPSILTPYKAFLADQCYSELHKAWGGDYTEINSSIPTYTNHKDLKDHLYVNYRIPHTLLLWREMIQMNYLSVMNPYLDRHVMDFVKSLPTNLRDGKRLYIDALKEISPHLFQQKRARVNRVKPDWGKEFNLHRAELEQWYSTNPSRLDEFFTPSSLKEILDWHQENPFSLSDFIGRAGRSAKYRYPLANKVLSEFIPLPPKALSSVLVLKRIFTLRAFLLNKGE